MMRPTDEQFRLAKLAVIDNLRPIVWTHAMQEAVHAVLNYAFGSCSTDLSRRIRSAVMLMRRLATEASEGSAMRQGATAADFESWENLINDLFTATNFPQEAPRSAPSDAPDDRATEARRLAIAECAQAVRGRYAGRAEGSDVWLEIGKIARMLERMAETGEPAPLVEPAFIGGEHVGYIITNPSPAPGDIIMNPIPALSGHQHRRDPRNPEHCILCGDALPSDFKEL